MTPARRGPASDAARAPDAAAGALRRNPARPAARPIHAREAVCRRGAGRRRTRRRRRLLSRRDPGYYNEIYVDAHDPKRSGRCRPTSIASRRWQDLVAGADAGRARRSSRHRVRSRRQEPRAAGQRWRALRNLRRDEDVAAFHQPAALSVRVATDNSAPSTTCAAARGQRSICGPSRTVNRAGIRTSDWYASAAATDSSHASIPKSPASSTRSRRRLAQPPRSEHRAIGGDSPARARTPP